MDGGRLSATAYDPLRHGTFAVGEKVGVGIEPGVIHILKEGGNDNVLQSIGVPHAGKDAAAVPHVGYFGHSSVRCSSIILLAGRPALAATEIHGADSSFRAEGITILWAILKGASEENSFVHIRILHDTAAAPAITLFGVEAVDPFSKERAWVMKGEPLGAIQTLKTVRTDFRDKTERWLHFYMDRESLEKGQPALTIFYHGVPDTAPELLTEADLEAYLAQALLRMK